MKQTAILLQTDIVDSTRLAESLGDAAIAALWIEHGSIARDLLTEWKGQELERSDGFLMRFETVVDAAQYAVAYHRAVANLRVPLRVRAGIHLGTLEFRQNSEVHVQLGAKATEADGLSIPLTVRIMSIAMGGQTLMSAVAKQALGPTTLRLASHGHWRLKGIEEPLELYEIGDGEAPFTPPPDAPKAYCVVRRNDQWLPRRDVPHSLPAERNAFIGREKQLQDLERRLDRGARLISVLGIGGTGKTRLVQHFGWRQLGDFPGGVWFCDLSQATTFDGICGAVAQGLAVPLGRADPVEQIGNAIVGRDACLMIVDNFEQVAHFARDTLGRWLDRANDARFVVTTRSVLGIDGEEVCTLPPMPQPEGADLFRRRAAAARSDFTLANDDEERLAHLVALLDGLPLAIEMAAARVRVMPLSTLLDRMGKRFTVLTTREGRPTRQATLRATFDWSWDLLAVVEKAALSHASVFEGGFDLAAFEATVDLCRFGDDCVAVDVLQSLVEKSWIQQSSTSRFSLLNSVQEYAAEHLASAGRFDGSGEALRDTAWDRHSDYFGSLAEEAVTADRCIEIDNLVVATRRSISRSRPAAATAALVNSWIALKQCGPYRTAEALASQVRALPDLPPACSARVEHVAGSALESMGSGSEAGICFRRGLAFARASGARFDEAQLLCALGEQLSKAGRVEEATTTLTEALLAAVALEDAFLQCIVLNALGTHAQSHGDSAASLERYREALVFAERLGHRRWVGALLGNMGIAHYGLGDREAARSHYVRALEVADRHGDLRWIGNTRSNLGLLLCDGAAHAEALVELEAALKIARNLGHLRLECVVLWNLGITLTAQQRNDEALVRYRDALALAARLDDHRSKVLLSEAIERSVAGSSTT